MDPVRKGSAAVNEERTESDPILMVPTPEEVKAEIGRLLKRLYVLKELLRVSEKAEKLRMPR